MSVVISSYAETDGYLLLRRAGVMCRDFDKYLTACNSKTANVPYISNEDPQKQGKAKGDKGFVLG